MSAYQYELHEAFRLIRKLLDERDQLAETLEAVQELCDDRWRELVGATPVAERAEIAPGLIEGITYLFDEYGPAGVLQTVQQMHADLSPERDCPESDDGTHCGCWAESEHCCLCGRFDTTTMIDRLAVTRRYLFEVVDPAERCP